MDALSCLKEDGRKEQLRHLARYAFWLKIRFVLVCAFILTAEVLRPATGNGLGKVIIPFAGAMLVGIALLPTYLSPTDRWLWQLPLWRLPAGRRLEVLMERGSRISATFLFFTVLSMDSIFQAHAVRLSLWALLTSMAALSLIGNLRKINEVKIERGLEPAGGTSGE